MKNTNPLQPQTASSEDGGLLGERFREGLTDPTPDIQNNPEGYTVFQKEMSDKFAEWYFSIKEQTGQPPLAMQIFYWFSKSLAELEEKDKEIIRLRALLGLCKPYIDTMQSDNDHDPSVGIFYDYDLHKLHETLNNL